MIADLLSLGKAKLLSLAIAMSILIALADWRVGNRMSLGVLYILPMVLAATVLTPWQNVMLALFCSALRSAFDLPSPKIEMVLRFVFAFLAYMGAGLFVTALTRIRVERDLRKEAEERLEILAESSPAAILTLDAGGRVLAANTAAHRLFLIPERQSLSGRAIGPYLPVLADALQLESGPEGLRTAAQCQGARDNGEVFLAHTWFSSYATPAGKRLAAIVVDASEEMREREEQGLQQLRQGNRIAAAAVSHEVRNLCGAISMVCSSLKDRHTLGQDEEFAGLTSLVGGLERIASVGLQWKTGGDLEEVGLQEVLNDLRIVIEPDWREIDGVVRWNLPDRLPRVVAQRHGLLQAFLNLAQNSHRAVQESSQRELSIEVAIEEHMASVKFRDTGPGISAPERLFRPFQPGSDGAGLGLYVARAFLRSYGGDLKFVPQPVGSCFIVEVAIV